MSQLKTGIDTKGKGTAVVAPMQKEKPAVKPRPPTLYNAAKPNFCEPTGATRTPETKRVCDWPAPRCLVENDNNVLSINKETAAILAGIRDEMVVVAIVGMYRTGKSHLMNHLAGKDGFYVGDAVQAKTKGIWIWCLPHPSRKDCCLALLDTEGLGDFEKANCQENDTMLFMVATLLSSVLVFNSIGSIDQTAMDKLQFITSFMEKIQVKTTVDDSDEEENDEIHEYCPLFVWVVRDFQLKLEVGGKPITSDEYLENALKLKKGLGKQTDEFNRPRQIFRRCFLRRKCFTFPRPRLSSGTDATLESEQSKSFEDLSNEFCQYIVANGHPKLVVGNILDGKKFVNFAQQYATSVTYDKMTVVHNVIEAVATNVNDDAIKESLQFYKDAMKKGLVMPVSNASVLEERHKRFETEALQLFMKRAMLTDKDDTKLREKCAAEIGKVYAEICHEDKTLSYDKSREVLQRLFQQIQTKLDSQHYFQVDGYKEFQADLEQLKRSYCEQSGKGIMADEALSEYERKYEQYGIAIKVTDEKLTETAKKASTDMEAMKARLLEANKAKQEADAAMKRINEEVRRLNEHCKEMEERLKREQREREEYMAKRSEELMEKMYAEFMEKRNQEKLVNVKKLDDMQTEIEVENPQVAVKTKGIGDRIKHALFGKKKKH